MPSLPFYKYYGWDPDVINAAKTKVIEKVVAKVEEVVKEEVSCVPIDVRVLTLVLAVTRTFALMHTRPRRPVEDSSRRRFPGSTPLARAL